MLVLSLFPGIGLLDHAFELEGFCVVRGPDLLWGGDIRNFHPPANRFDGIIGGPPCQDFSRARRNIPPTGNGEAMLLEYARVVTQAQPQWWLLENVERTPNVSVPGYITHRIDLNALECGSNQNRLRHFQFGSLNGITITPKRDAPGAHAEPCATATEGKRSSRRSWPDFCELQGLPRDFTLPGFTVEESYRAVGNGVPIPMGRRIAQAIAAMRDSSTNHICDPAQHHSSTPASHSHICDMAGSHNRDSTIVQSPLCACGCGRQIVGRIDKKCATPGCRKRLEMARKRPRKTIQFLP